jgi:hypothetical protein
MARQDASSELMLNQGSLAGLTQDDYLSGLLENKDFLLGPLRLEDILFFQMAY